MKYLLTDGWRERELARRREERFWRVVLYPEDGKDGKEGRHERGDGGP